MEAGPARLFVDEELRAGLSDVGWRVSGDEVAPVDESAGEIAQVSRIYLHVDPDCLDSRVTLRSVGPGGRSARPAPLSDGTGYALRRSGSDVAGGEDAGPDRLQQVWLTLGRPPAVRPHANRCAVAAPDVAGLVEVQHSMHRFGRHRSSRTRPTPPLARCSRLPGCGDPRAPAGPHHERRRPRFG